jgi:hypothetical protein
MSSASRQRELRRQLRDLLAELYTEPQHARRVIDDAGLPKDRVSLGGPAQDIWYSAVELAGKLNLLEQLMEVAAREYPDRLELEQLRARLAEPGVGEETLALLQPGRSETSPRLEKAVIELQEKVAQGRRLIALRGRPGDGKTQVGTRFAQLRPNGRCLPLTSVAQTQPGGSWREGLQVLLGALTQDEVRDAPSTVLARQIKDILASIEELTLVIDNADTRPDFPIAELLPGRGRVVCVVVGSGVTEVDDEVQLLPPDEEEFITIALGGAQVDEEKRNVVASIATATSYSALVAKFLFWQGAPKLSARELREYEKALVEGELHQDDIFQRAIQKCWSSLGKVERQRVAFLAALGEPEVPRSWLPRKLREGHPIAWRMLDRSGVTEQEGEEGERLRLHRVIASWARQQVDETVDQQLAETLEAWALEPDLRDEFKARGVRARAFVSAFRLLDEHGHLSKLSKTALALLSKMFLDLLPRLHDEEANEDFRRVVPREDAVEKLSPFVQGQLLDTLPGNPVHASPVSSPIRERVLKALQQRFLEQEPPREPQGPEGWMEVSAAHHLAKDLVRTKDPENLARAQKLYRWEEAVCLAAVARELGFRNWHIQLANTRLQLGRMVALPQEERIRFLEQVVDAEEAPDYLRLAAIAALVSPKGPTLTDQQRRELLDRGLELCRPESNLRQQVGFLKWASNELTKLRDQPRFERLHEVAQLVKRRMEQHPPHLVADDSVTLAHAFHRVAVLDARAQGLETMSAEVSLYEGIVRRANAFHHTRIAALLRDMGLPGLVKPITSALLERKDLTVKNRYFTEFEQAKALRWLGSYGDAESLLRGMLERYPEEACPIRDELAKVLVSQGRLEQAAERLKLNTEEYKDPVFKEACRRWLEGLGKQEPRGANGLLEDEWLRAERERASSPELVERVKKRARALYERLMASVEAGKAGP